MPCQCDTLDFRVFSTGVPLNQENELLLAHLRGDSSFEANLAEYHRRAKSTRPKADPRSVSSSRWQGKAVTGSARVRADRTAIVNASARAERTAIVNASVRADRTAIVNASVRADRTATSRTSARRGVT